MHLPLISSFFFPLSCFINFSFSWQRPFSILMFPSSFWLITVVILTRKFNADFLSIGVLPNVIPGGLKLELIGPITCRRGKMFLRKGSVRVLGGQVDELAAKFSTVNILKERIGQKLDAQPSITFKKPPVSHQQRQDRTNNIPQNTARIHNSNSGPPSSFPRPQASRPTDTLNYNPAPGRGIYCAFRSSLSNPTSAIYFFPPAYIDADGRNFMTSKM